MMRKTQQAAWSPALPRSSSDGCGDPDSMLMCLSFSIKTSCACTSSANTNPDAQGAAVSNLGCAKGAVKIAEALSFGSCQ